MLVAAAHTGVSPAAVLSLFSCTDQTTLLTLVSAAVVPCRHAATASYRACIIYPASIRYGREPGLVLLILLIGMAYCVAAPLITVFVFVYMVTA